MRPYRSPFQQAEAMVKKRSQTSASGKCGASTSHGRVKVKKDGSKKIVGSWWELENKKIVPMRLRTWDDQATRAVKLKLSCFPASQVRGNKNKDGKLIYEMVVAELMRLKPQRKHIALAFWQEIIKDHNLHGGFSSTLAVPEADEIVSKELNMALQVAHNSNPAQTTSAKLLRYLEYAPKSNHTELRGLLLGAVESPSMSRSMSFGILEGVLKYVSRTRCDELFPEVWGQVGDHFDGMLVTLWQRSQAKQMSRSQFLRCWRGPLLLFMNMEDAVSVNAGSEDKTGYDAAKVEALVNSSLIGAELFAPESASCEVDSYVADIDKRLFELEQADFTETEVQAFIAMFSV